MRGWLKRTRTAAAAVERKFQVAVKPTKLEGFSVDDYGPKTAHQKLVCVKMKWRGEPVRFLPLIQRSSTGKMEFSTEEIWMEGHQIVSWEDDDRWFQNTCCFSVLQNHSDQRFEPWEIVLDILRVEKVSSKAKAPVVVGRVSVDIAEIAWKTDKSCVERKFPVMLKIEGVDKEAFLTVLFSFAEIREPRGSLTVISGESMKSNVGSGEMVGLDESTTLSTEETNTIHRIQLDSCKKQGWFPWNKRAKTEDNTLDKTTESSSTVLQDEDLTKTCLESEIQQEESTTCAWEYREFISKDGKTKVKAGVSFASFDQRSENANGESACTALALVISHWLNLNKDELPDRLEFDNLIEQGSSEWRTMCENADYVRDFPNKHFDLETVVRANIRPVSILYEKSFVGFFGAEKFESLKGAMSFDEIWTEISGNAAVKPSIYIVSWHEHFFVLKVEEKANHIIDTLGERLFEGCNQAYMLTFDDSAILMQMPAVDKETANQPRTKNTNTEEETETEKIICSGKDCCGEYIKRFLAAIPLQELEEEEKVKGVSYFSLYQRLQIEFNYSCCAESDTSSSMSSIFSSPNTSASSSLRMKDLRSE